MPKTHWMRRLILLLQQTVWQIPYDKCDEKIYSQCKASADIDHKCNWLFILFAMAL